MNYDIWATTREPEPEPGEIAAVFIERYTTREGVLAKARVLLKQGRSVEIIPVPDNAPPSEARR